MPGSGFLRTFRSSIRAKLVLMMALTTLCALLIAGTVMIGYDLRSYETSARADLATQAEILGRASASAISFNDRSVALENLSLLRVRPHIVDGAVYTSHGALFASYSRDPAPGAAEIPRHPGKPGIWREGDHLVLFQQIADRSEVVGTVYLRARYESAERLADFAKILAVVIMLSLLVAVWLSTWLQAAVTRPIESVAEVARQVRERRDYSLRADAGTQDEIGYFAESFNGMLAEIEKANQRLQIALDAGELGDWNLDATTGDLTLGARAARTVGLEPGVPYSRSRIRQLLPPEDAERARAALDRALADHTDYGVEYRVNVPGGRQIWIMARGRGRYADDGSALEMTGVMQDITRRKAEEQALREADARKDEFLAILAHELRNPLAPLRTSLYLLRVAEHDKAVVRQARDVMERQVAQLVRLVDDLLDISRITTGKLELRRERVDLKTVLERALEAAGPLLAARKQEIQVSLPAERLPLDADPTRLAQVFINLLNNAGKFSPAGRTVTVRAARDDGAAVVEIVDQGIGIAPEMLASIFQMFVQADASLEREQAGLGVGLSLARHLVDLHGGTITVASRGKGQGSRFTVRVPLAQDAAAGGAVNAGSSPARQAARRILLADDNEDFATTMAMMLRMLGHEVRVAHDGEQALAEARAFEPEFAFLDIGLPKLNGYDLARGVRSLPLARRPFLVAVTGWGQDADVQRARDAGFDLHLVKPIDPSRLEAILATPPGAPHPSAGMRDAPR